MADSWKLSISAPREIVEAALEEHDDAFDSHPRIVLSAREVDEASGEWMLEAWFDHDPTGDEVEEIAALFPPPPPEVRVERLPDQDWVTLSQAGMDPIRAGRFRVRTPDHAALENGETIELVIPAAQAFGTGQHATTAGCLLMLDRMNAQGIAPASVVDVGTGTGLLAFAAARLWPNAQITASDIDPVCESVLRDNADLNAIGLGTSSGAVAYVTAPGLDHPTLLDRAPYDLLIANILAGPLIELAASFAPHVSPGGHVILAGLLAVQEDAVIEAYRSVGIELAHSEKSGDWSILWLSKSERPAAT